jgi:amidohydrolase
MRVLQAFLVSHLLFVSPCSSLPFGSRTKKEVEEQEKKEQQLSSQDDATRKEKVSVRGAASKVFTTNESQPVTSDESSPHKPIETFFLSPPSDEDASLAVKKEIQTLANSTSMQHFLSTTRRSLHRHPEIMYQESFTSEIIQDILTELDISYTTGWAKNIHQDVYPGPGGYGIVAHIGTQSEDQPCIILRADMDALPIEESTKGIQEFKSLAKGKMHACGHDGHTTMLLGAAALLKNVEASIQGTIRLVFQPAEEGGAGGKRMVEEGVVSLSPPAQHAFGMHVWPTLPTGSIASRPGPLLAAAETFLITIEGRGGHAAMPHLTIDPLVTASSLIMNLQTIISRNVSPLASGVVSVTAINAGDAFNVIPASAVIKGTVRALSTEMLMELRDKVEHITQSTAALYGCNSTISYSPDFYPPTVNDATLFQWSKTVGAMVSKEGYLRDIEPTMGGEDFSFLAETIPSTFFLVGPGSGGDEKYHLPRTDYGLHHPSFALDEEVMPIGVELHANLALRSLKKLAHENDGISTEEL